MMSLDSIRRDLTAHSQFLRRSVAEATWPTDVRHLEQWQGVVTLINHFEGLCTWYVDALEAAPSTESHRDFDLYWNTGKLYDEFDDIRRTALQLLAPLQLDWHLLLVDFVKGVLQTLHQDIYTPDEPLTILIRDGRNFVLTRHLYCPHVLTLTIPLAAMSQPHQWSMIWHELGSLLVFPTKKKPRQWIPTRSKDSYSLYMDIQDRVNKLTAEMQGRSEFFSEALRKEIRIIKRAGRNGANGRSAESREFLQNYVEEWCEDSISIQALGAVGYVTLEEALSNTYSDTLEMQEDRHPPPLLRLLVARGLLQRQQRDILPIQEALGRLEGRLQALAPEVRAEMEAIAAFVSERIGDFPLVKSGQAHWSQALVRQAVEERRQGQPSSAERLRAGFVPIPEARSQTAEAPGDWLRGFMRGLREFFAPPVVSRDPRLERLLAAQDAAAQVALVKQVRADVLRLNDVAAIRAVFASFTQTIDKAVVHPDREQQLAARQAQVEMSSSSASIGLLDSPEDDALPMELLSELVFSLDDPGNCSGCTNSCCKKCKSNCQKCCK